MAGNDVNFQSLKEIAAVYGVSLRDEPNPKGFIIASKDGTKRELTTEEFVKSIFPEWEGKR
ncbi:hypothetical protein ACJGE4_15615 [Bacillus velezensis]|uniref:hypothetical protein n=1 Tax=Bacillus TaxID=1386 RepID=UPI000C059249|nr:MULTISPECIES: hypothetical protein [Bacillus amyloliquefaciens group]ATO08508.1 hypothetical protein CRH11_00105 [Bacillus velezensis]ATO12240.1 hypothetical protein CRH11_20560 [Bacillus velezensis]AZI48246.1 hypothetical protein BVMH_15680 [Bacillus velezensis]MED4523578.1 hypothetical protein [Bacillus velezensis]QAW23938.1 hypothetical protein ETA12_04660 [Bacillus velezensis]